jgi:hypothetical protein
MTTQPKGLCHNGKEFESCLMYRIGKCCDPRYQKEMTEEEIAAIKKAMGVKD